MLSELVSQLKYQAGLGTTMKVTPSQGARWLDELGQIRDRIASLEAELAEAKRDISEFKSTVERLGGELSDTIAKRMKSVQMTTEALNRADRAESDLAAANAKLAGMAAALDGAGEVLDVVRSRLGIPTDGSAHIFTGGTKPTGDDDIGIGQAIADIRHAIAGAGLEVVPGCSYPVNNNNIGVRIDSQSVSGCRPCTLVYPKEQQHEPA